MILKQVGNKKKQFKPRPKSDVMTKEDIDRWFKQHPPMTSNRSKANSLGDKKNKRRY